ncbi:T9SS type A sorting domain-containing protein [Dyadobacter sp. CY323]|uniref:T9SS type A sorting domain-containing protein n=1 Tax=Dyadobacter sp. CY323 TaxID=2907302 RepID=UPI001F211F34|nr:T9SS type A sorting domain-containing protein [Dyadobacter sp. CY323]MCE6991301.1 T9SS type A sorting domain-containing protein [Dyadobacter sp. CY323]
MKKTILLLFFLFSVTQIFAQAIQGTIKMGSHSKEVYLTIRNNTASSITGNITKLQFSLAMTLENYFTSLKLTDFSILPKPATGSFSQSAFTHMYVNYAEAAWTGSKSISLAPGEEMNLASFGLNGTPAWGLSKTPTLYLINSSFYHPILKWLIEVDGVDYTVGRYKYYDSGSASYISNEMEYGSVNLSTFGIANLPVTLASFEGTSHEGAAHLSWTTTDESNSSHFEIENSLNAKDWKLVGRVTSTGESATLHKYSFVHLRPAPGKNYYRLKMVDEDATFAYSKMVSLDLNGGSEGGIYPNPVADRLLFTESDLADIAKVQIFQTSGKLVSESTKVDEAGIDVRHLPAGLFVVKMEKLNGATVRYKMMKK